MHIFPVQPKRHINSRRISVEAMMTTGKTWWAVPALVVLLICFCHALRPALEAVEFAREQHRWDVDLRDLRRDVLKY